MFVSCEPSPVYLDYKGVKIYEVYRDNRKYKGRREYWFGTSPYVDDECSDGPEAPFDVRSMKGYRAKMGVKENLKRMIDKGLFDSCRDFADDEWHFADEDEDRYTLKTADGRYVVTKGDSEYNGINVDFAPEGDKYVYPLVTVENEEGKGKIAIYVYGNLENDEPTDKIEVNLGRFGKKAGRKRKGKKE